MIGRVRLVDRGLWWDPVTIGAAVAVLAGKQLIEKVGEEAGESGWGLANTILGKVRGWFSFTDSKAADRLGELEKAKDPSPGDMRAVAELIDKRLEAAPDLATELAELVDQARKDPVLRPVLSQEGLVAAAGATVITQTATGDGNIQVGQAGRSVTVTGSPATRPEP